MQGDGKTSRLRITIAYATAGLSGKPGKTCNIGNLNGAKTSTSSFPTQLLYYNLMIKPLIKRQAELTFPAFLFSHLQMLSSLSKGLIVNLVITY